MTYSKEKNWTFKNNIIMEPLIWQWYAWSHLISPITAGCNIHKRHIKIMESFVHAPDIHEQACKNSELKSGAFMDLKKSNADTIKDLLYKTNTECDQLISLAKDYHSFNAYLQKDNCGQSLEPLYHKIPKSLKGCIEIVYDINNHPSIRLIEPILYQKYYTPRGQSILLSEMQSEQRPFVLNTPRILTQNSLQMPIAFKDARIDMLAKMRTEGISQQALENLLDTLRSEADDLLKFIDQKSYIHKTDNHYKGNGIRIRYFGHACILLQTKDINILIDPVISYKNNQSIPRYTFEDLPDTIDYVLLTHNHQDHVQLETLLQLRYKIKNIIIPTGQKGVLPDPCLKLMLQSIGFDSVITLDELQTFNFDDGRIIGIPFLGEHADLNIQTKIAFYIQINNKSMLFCADSNNLDPAIYEHVFGYLGALDMLFIGMECEGAPLSWLYGPLLTNPLSKAHNHSRRLSGCDEKKAWEIVKITQCKQAYVYAMGQEPWLTHIMGLNCTEDSPQLLAANAFLKTCKEHKIISERLYGQKEWLIEGDR